MIAPSAILAALLALLLSVSSAWSQELPFTLNADADAAEAELAVAGLAEEILSALQDSEDVRKPAALYRLQLAAGRYAEAHETIRQFHAQLVASDDAGSAESLLPMEVYARARQRESERRIEFDKSYRDAFRDSMRDLDDLTANRVAFWFSANVERAGADFMAAAKQYAGDETISLKDAIGLVRRFVFFEAYRATAPLTEALIAEDNSKRYITDENARITTPEGVTLSAVVVRPRGAPKRRPTALQFTIYTWLERHLIEARTAAAHGYVGVVADARGKRLSTDDIRPFEVEADDARAVIDWISRQKWSNGEVGMYGGSYLGFAAWAALKHPHPALRTIATYATALPGQGLPMENNVFLNANYAWNFLVSNNRELDANVYGDVERWNGLNEKWYASGRPYREIDAIDGTPNPILQRQLQHPAYDEYWQSMVPYGEEFARIDIPVLTVTGYYDDGQISALHYLREHYRHNADAEHYLVIGPYDHTGVQAQFKPPAIRGYTIDPAAQFDTVALTFEWFDYVMRGGEKPELLRDRINAEVMGADAWRNAPTLEALNNDALTFYLSDKVDGDRRLLSRDKPAQPRALRQTVDFADRTTSSASYYPDPIVSEKIELPSGYAFVSAPFNEAVDFNGGVSGALNVIVNKRDFDFTVILYEITPSGETMELSYYVGRASYAEDMTRRRLLTPGAVESIPFERSYFASRRLSAGSRLLVVIDVMKNQFHQINYGTGGDVSAESIADADEPLQIQWRTDSYIRLPVWREPPPSAPAE